MYPNGTRFWHMLWCQEFFQIGPPFQQFLPTSSPSSTMAEARLPHESLSLKFQYIAVELKSAQSLPIETPNGS